MDCRSALKAATLKIFHHHLYELSKGLRPLAMMTLTREEAAPVIAELVASGAAHHVQNLCRAKVNVVFGRPAAVATAATLLARPLCELAPEQDFMLGILLGYDREQQCLRYLARAEAGRVEPVEVADAGRGLVH
jgi:hypothetical protein